MSKDIPSDLILSETQVRRVIELATRVTPRSDGVSLAMLRQIADELDIDQDALLHAVREVLANPEEPGPRKKTLSRARRNGPDSLLAVQSATDTAPPEQPGPPSGSMWRGRVSPTLLGLPVHR